MMHSLSRRRVTASLCGSRLALVAVAGVFATLASTSPARAGGDDVVLIQFLANSGVDADATSRVRWRDKGDSTDFNVEVEHVPVGGSYHLFVGGFDRGVLTPDGLPGAFEIEFKSPLDPPKPLFDFAVFSEVIEVRDGAGTVFFSQVFDPSGTGGSAGGGTSGPGGGGVIGGPGLTPSKGKSKMELDMTKVSPDDFDAKGRLRFESKSKKGVDELRFEVDSENLDVGAYVVWLRGSDDASVADDLMIDSFDVTPGIREVELDFRSPAHDDPAVQVEGATLEHNVSLDFDPLGRIVDVVRTSDGAVVLTGLLPESAAVSGVKTPKGPSSHARDIGRSKADALQLGLLNNGLLPKASGRVVLVQDGTDFDLTVEIEGVADGTYGVFIHEPGGSLGAQQAVAVIGGQGEARFRTQPTDDPDVTDISGVVLKGATVTVHLGDDADDPVLLTVVLANSVQEAVQRFGKTSIRSDKKTGELSSIRMGLLNVGEFGDDAGRRDLDAVGDLTWRKRNLREWLQLALKDLAEGTYYIIVVNHPSIESRPDLVVAEAQVGKKGRLKISFESDLAPEKVKANVRLNLDFQVLGMVIRITDTNFNVLLQVQVPA